MLIVQYYNLSSNKEVEPNEDEGLPIIGMGHKIYYKSNLHVQVCIVTILIKLQFSYILFADCLA